MLPYTVALPQADVDALSARLARVRWTNELPDAGTAYGVDLASIKRLVTYWHECMRSPQVARQTVAVRYEPYDMGVLYAYIGGQWIACIADLCDIIWGDGRYR